MLAKYFKEESKERYSFGEILENGLINYSSIAMPFARPLSPSQSEIVEKTDFFKLTPEQVKTMKTNTLVHIYNKNKTFPLYIMPLLGLYGFGFIALTFVISSKVKKYPVKYFGSLTNSYKQLFIRGTLLSAIYCSYLTLGGIAIFYPHHPIIKIRKGTIIENEIIERHCLFDSDARKEFLEATLRFYNFDEEFIKNTMIKADDINKEQQNILYGD